MSDRHPDVLLFSHPRTLSNLFCKMMSQQDAFNHHEYHFHDGFVDLVLNLNDKPLSEYTDEQRNDYYDLLTKGYNRLFAEQAAAHAQNRPIFFKNHVLQTWEPSSLNQDYFGGTPSPVLKLTGDKKHTNGTLLPDSFLLSAVPIFIIRHPILQTESWYRANYRAGDPDVTGPLKALQSNLRHCRELLEWYVANVPSDVPVDSPTLPGPFQPMVIDADDLLGSAKAIEEVCRRSNFDPAKVLYEWSETKQHDDMSSFQKSYSQDIMKSTGVDKSKSSQGVTMEVKYEQWKGEWGVEVADFLKTNALGAMDDYEYMKKRKV